MNAQKTTDKKNIREIMEEINADMYKCSKLKENGLKDSVEYKTLISETWLKLTSEKIERHYINRVLKRMLRVDNNDTLEDNIRTKLVEAIDKTIFSYDYNRVVSTGRGKGGYIKKKNGQYILHKASESKNNDNCFIKLENSCYAEGTYLYKFKEQIKNADRKSPFFIKIYYKEDENKNISDVYNYEDCKIKDCKEGFFISVGFGTDTNGNKNNKMYCYIIPQISKEICELDKDFVEKNINKKFLININENEYIPIFYYQVEKEIKGLSFFSIIELESEIVHTSYITYMERIFEYMIRDLAKNYKMYSVISIDSESENSEDEPAIQIRDTGDTPEEAFLKKQVVESFANLLFFIQHTLNTKRNKLGASFEIFNKFYSTELERYFLDFEQISELPKLKQHENEIIAFIDIDFLNYIMQNNCKDFKSMVSNRTIKRNGKNLDFPIKPMIYIEYYDNKQPKAKIHEMKNKNKYISDKKNKFIQILESIKTKNDSVQGCIVFFIDNFKGKEDN